MLTPDQIAELKRLHEAATPEPWEEIAQLQGGPIIAHRYESGQQMNPVSLRLIGQMFQRRDSLAVDVANAALFVALRNALPSIIADLETVAKLYRTADGVAVVGEMKLFGIDADGEVVSLTSGEPTLWIDADKSKVWDFCANTYSTIEAALAAKGDGK